MAMGNHPPEYSTGTKGLGTSMELWYIQTKFTYQYQISCPSHFQDAFVKIVRAEGALSLWSGLSPTLVLALPATVVYFTTYEQLRHWMNDRFSKEGEKHKSPWLHALAAGGIARIWAVTLVSPLELIRTKMQSKKLSYSEVGVAVRELVQAQGVKGLWRGLAPSLLRDVPFSGRYNYHFEMLTYFSLKSLFTTALYWASYESYKKFLPGPDLTLVQSFTGGALSGTVSLSYKVNN